MAPVVKDPPAKAGDMGSIPESGRSPEGGHHNPLQHPCPENPVDRGARLALVHRVAKSQTRLKQLRMCIETRLTKYDRNLFQMKEQKKPLVGGGGGGTNKTKKNNLPDKEFPT